MYEYVCGVAIEPGEQRRKASIHIHTHIHTHTYIYISEFWSILLYFWVEGLFHLFSHFSYCYPALFLSFNQPLSSLIASRCCCCPWHATAANDASSHTGSMYPQHGKRKLLTLMQQCLVLLQPLLLSVAASTPPIRLHPHRHPPPPAPSPTYQAQCSYPNATASPNASTRHKI